MAQVWEVLTAALLLLGAAFTLLGSFGLVRFPDLLMRLHGPSKASTLGLGGLLLASAIGGPAPGSATGYHVILITVFVVLTAPVTALCIARAALARGEAGASAGTLASSTRETPNAP